MYTHVYLTSFTIYYCVNFPCWLFLVVPHLFSLLNRKLLQSFTAQYPPGSKDEIYFSRTLIKIQRSKEVREEMYLLLHLRRDQYKIRSYLCGPRQDPHIGSRLCVNLKISFSHKKISISKATSSSVSRPQLSKIDRTCFIDLPILWIWSCAR